jgi:hypothetical protein
VSSLNRKQVELSKFVAVGVTISSTWVGCCAHSSLRVRTVLEVLLRRHGDVSPALCLVVAVRQKTELCRFLQRLVHVPAEVLDHKKECLNAKNHTFLDKCSRICSMVYSTFSTVVDTV